MSGFGSDDDHHNDNDDICFEDIEKEYSPSEWSKRLNSDEIIDYHVKFVTEVSQRNREKYKQHANIPYGTTPMETMDIYFKNFACENPILVYIHGGYWQMLNKNVSAYCVGPFVENGFRVIIVDYELCPKITLEEIVNQIKKAARTIFAYADRTGARSVSFCGHSAGAHLIACLLQDNEIMSIPNINLLKSVFLISGVYDLNPLRYLYSVNPNNLLSLNDENINKLSPIHSNFEHLKNILNEIKIFIYVAEMDSLVFKKQSKKFYCHLKTKYNLDTKYRIVPNVDHFNIVENLICSNLSIITRDIIDELLKYHTKRLEWERDAKKAARGEITF